MAKIKLIVDGGSMSPGPAVAQQLGPMGINIGKVIEEVNKATSGFKGMKVPVELDVDAKTKNFTVTVSSPPVSELIKKELKLEKASGEAGKTYLGNLAIEQAISIAKTKMPDMLAKNTKTAVKLVVGSCVSLGIMVENKNAKEAMREIEEGKYDSEINSEKTELSPDKKSQLDIFFLGVKAKQDADAKAAEEAKAAAEASKTTVAAPTEGEKPAEASAKPGEKKEEKKDEKKK